MGVRAEQKQSQMPNRAKRYRKRAGSFVEALRVLALLSEDADLWRAMEKWGGLIHYYDYSKRYSAMIYGEWQTNSKETWQEAARELITYKTFGVNIDALPKEVTNDEPST